MQVGKSIAARFRHGDHRRGWSRRAIVVLELILWLPVLMIFLAALIEFALLYQVDKQVAYASRFGAKIASEQSRINLRTLNTGNPSLLKSQIDSYLATVGLGPSCEVFLEHNVCSGHPFVQQSPPSIPAGCRCAPVQSPVRPLEPSPYPGSQAHPEFVRVTVCVRVAGNVPDLLDTFGFALKDATLRHSTTFRYEPVNSPPTPIMTVPVQSIDPMSVDLVAEPNFESPGGSQIVTSPPASTLVTITAPDNAPANTVVSVNLNSLASSDAEDPFGSLVFQWASAASLSSSSGTTTTATLPIPNSPGSQDRIVTLTVTDRCGRSQAAFITFRLVRL